jgi:hypothetical protein
LARNTSKTNARRSGPNPVLRLQAIRQIHLYLGVFFAPALLFFAATGALQLFSLHEAHPGYQPAPLIEKLGEVHKNQKFELKARRPEKPRPASAARAAPEKPRPVALSTLALKWFFLATALGLIVSTCLGLWMGLKYSRNKVLALVLLCAGAVAPVLILML